MGLEPPTSKGIPALAGLRGIVRREYQGRLVRRVGGSPKPRQAIWEVPEALRQPHCVAVWMRGWWVFPRMRETVQGVQFVGVSPGETDNMY